MLNIIKKTQDAKILVVTPLLTRRKISGQTRASIQRNDIPYTWVSFKSGAKHAWNVQACIDAYEKKYNNLPEFIQVLDDDIIMGRHMLDRFYELLKKSHSKIGYVYCPFSYRGHMEVSFPPIEFDPIKLMKGNWISSNSMYRTSAIKAVGGFVVEPDTHRLSDWAMWLKLYIKGYMGKLCTKTSFVAMSTSKDISAGGVDEFQIARDTIVRRYITPHLSIFTGAQNG